MAATELIILIIDDSKVITERLVSILEELPVSCSILVGSNYDDGMILLDENACDVAILDINLPGKSGIELLRLIKAREYFIKTIIAMTDDPSAEKRDLCLALGADYFLNKFSDFEQIPEIIFHQT